MLECPVPSWWNCLGKIRCCGLIGGEVALLGDVCHWDFEILKAYAGPDLTLFLPPACGSGCNLSLLPQCHACLPFASLPTTMILFEPSETVSKLPTNFSFYKLPWPWDFITAIEQ